MLQKCDLSSYWNYVIGDASIGADQKLTVAALGLDTVVAVFAKKKAAKTSPTYSPVSRAIVMNIK